MKNRIFSFLLLCFFGGLVSAQEAGEKEDPEFFKRSRVTVLLSHTVINTALLDEENLKVFPSYGFNYDYWFNEKFAIGLHNDLIGESFAIRRSDNGVALERDIPFTTLLVAIYKLDFGLAPLVGLGAELERNETLFVCHLGLEYGVEFAEVWEVGANLTYDFKLEAYNSLAYGFSLSRRF